METFKPVKFLTLYCITCA